MQIAPIPYLEGLKTYTSDFKVEYFLTLPADTPYGSLTITYSQIITRIECLNKSIESLFNGFYAHLELVKVRGGWSTADETFMYKFEIEQVIYWLRKTADEFICIIYIILEHKASGLYPKQISVSSIGKFLKLENKAKFGLDGHIGLFTILNDISNAYKHTLLNSQAHNHHNLKEPTVIALSAFNVASDKPKFYSCLLRDILTHYDMFLKDTRALLANDYPPVSDFGKITF